MWRRSGRAELRLQTFHRDGTVEPLGPTVPSLSGLQVHALGTPQHLAARAAQSDGGDVSASHHDEVSQLGSAGGRIRGYSIGLVASRASSKSRTAGLSDGDVAKSSRRECDHDFGTPTAIRRCAGGFCLATASFAHELVGDRYKGALPPARRTCASRALRALDAALAIGWT